MSIDSIDQIELAITVKKESSTGIFNNPRMLLIKSGFISYYSQQPSNYVGNARSLELSGLLPKLTLSAEHVQTIERSKKTVIIRFRRGNLIETDSLHRLINREITTEDLKTRKNPADDELVEWQFKCKSAEFAELFVKQTMFCKSDPKLKPQLDKFVQGYRDAKDLSQSRRTIKYPERLASIRQSHEGKEKGKEEESLRQSPQPTQLNLESIPLRPEAGGRDTILLESRESYVQKIVTQDVVEQQKRNQYLRRQNAIEQQGVQQQMGEQLRMNNEVPPGQKVSTAEQVISTVVAPYEPHAQLDDKKGTVNPVAFWHNGSNPLRDISFREWFQVLYPNIMKHLEKASTGDKRANASLIKSHQQGIFKIIKESPFYCRYGPALSLPTGSGCPAQVVNELSQDLAENRVRQEAVNRFISEINSPSLAVSDIGCVIQGHRALGESWELHLESHQHSRVARICQVYECLKKELDHTISKTQDLIEFPSLYQLEYGNSPTHISGVYLRLYDPNQWQQLSQSSQDINETSVKEPVASLNKSIREIADAYFLKRYQCQLQNQIIGSRCGLRYKKSRQTGRVTTTVYIDPYLCYSDCSGTLLNPLQLHTQVCRIQTVVNNRRPSAIPSVYSQKFNQYPVDVRDQILRCRMAQLLIQNALIKYPSVRIQGVAEHQFVGLLIKFMSTLYHRGRYQQVIDMCDQLLATYTDCRFASGDYLSAGQFGQPPLNDQLVQILLFKLLAVSATGSIPAILDTLESVNQLVEPMDSEHRIRMLIAIMYVLRKLNTYAQNKDVELTRNISGYLKLSYEDLKRRVFQGQEDSLFKIDNPIMYCAMIELMDHAIFYDQDLQVVLPKCQNIIIYNLQLKGQQESQLNTQKRSPSAQHTQSMQSTIDEINLETRVPQHPNQYTDWALEEMNFRRDFFLEPTEIDYPQCSRYLSVFVSKASTISKCNCGFLNPFLDSRGLLCSPDYVLKHLKVIFLYCCEGHGSEISQAKWIYSQLQQALKGHRDQSACEVYAGLMAIAAEGLELLEPSIRKRISQQLDD